MGSPQSDNYQITNKWIHKNDITRELSWHRPFTSGLGILVRAKQNLDPITDKSNPQPARTVCCLELWPSNRSLLWLFLLDLLKWGYSTNKVRGRSQPEISLYLHDKLSQNFSGLIKFPLFLHSSYILLLLFLLLLLLLLVLLGNTMHLTLVATEIERPLLSYSEPHNKE